MKGIEFILDLDKSASTGVEYYRVYDGSFDEYLSDISGNETVVMIDRAQKMIHFGGMYSDSDRIVDKMYYYKIISQFLGDADYYKIDGYHISPDTSGGKIYYKYSIYR